MSARVIDFDIETYRTRNERVLESLYSEVAEKRPAQNKSKEEKALWDTAESRATRLQEAVSDTAKDVLLAEVLCVAWAEGGEGTDQRDGDVQVMSEWDENSEALMLMELASVWSAVATAETVWAGHNVIGYDLPVLLNRWRRFEIRPPEHYPKYVNGRWIGRVFDTMQRTPCRNGLGFVSQDAVMEALGIPNPGYEWRGAPMTGKRVAEAYEAGEYAVISEYCKTDVWTQRALRRAMTFGDTWGMYDSRAAVGEQARGIWTSEELSEEARALALVNLYRMHGLAVGL